MRRLGALAHQHISRLCRRGEHHSRGQLARFRRAMARRRHTTPRRHREAAYSCGAVEIAAENCVLVAHSHPGRVELRSCRGRRRVAAPAAGAARGARGARAGAARLGRRRRGGVQRGARRVPAGRPVGPGAATVRRDARLGRRARAAVVRGGDGGGDGVAPPRRRPRGLREAAGVARRRRGAVGARVHGGDRGVRAGSAAGARAAAVWRDGGLQRPS